MNKVVKRLSALTVAVVMIVALFAGCAQKGGNASGSGQQADTKSQGNITLKFTTWVNNKDLNGNYLDELITKEFTKQNPNLKVEFQLLTENNSNEYMQKTDLMIAGGEDIDVVSYSNRNEYADRVARGMLAPLDEYIAAEGKKYSDMYTLDTAVNGKIYAFPWDLKPGFVMMNKKYLDEAGLPVPKPDWTWDDYREYAKKLTKGDGKDKRYGGYFHTFSNYKIFPITNAYDFWPILKKDGTSNLLDPNIKWALQFMHDLEAVDKSHLPYFEAKSGKLSYRDLFFQGKVAMIPIGAWMIPEVSSTLDKYPHDWVTAFATVPKFKDYPAGATTGDGNFCAIPKSSKHKAEAYKLVKFNCDEGVYIRATGLPAKKDYNMDQLLKTMLNGKENLYDVASLKAVLGGVKLNSATNIFPYNKKVSDAVESEFEKYLVGGATLDSTIENADKITKEIISAGK